MASLARQELFTFLVEVALLLRASRRACEVAGGLAQRAVQRGVRHEQRAQVVPRARLEVRILIDDLEKVYFQ